MICRSNIEMTWRIAADVRPFDDGDLCRGRTSRHRRLGKCPRDLERRDRKGGKDLQLGVFDAFPGAPCEVAKRDHCLSEFFDGSIPVEKQPELFVGLPPRSRPAAPTWCSNASDSVLVSAPSYRARTHASRRRCGTWRPRRLWAIATRPGTTPTEGRRESEASSETFMGHRNSRYCASRGPAIRHGRVRLTFGYRLVRRHIGRCVNTLRNKVFGLASQHSCQAELVDGAGDVGIGLVGEYRRHSASEWRCAHRPRSAAPRMRPRCRAPSG